MTVSSLARFTLPLMLVTLVALSGTTSAVSLPMQYYERTVASDTAEDYAANGALDIVGVHLAERYQYDSGNRSGKDTVQFRIELRARDDVKFLPPDKTDAGSVTLTPVEYTLGFTAGAKKVQQTVTLTQVCLVAAPPGGGGLDCNKLAPTVPAPHFTTASGGVVLVLDRTAAGLPVGVPITKVWAASATLSQDQKTYQDVAPKDNANQAEGASLAEPTTPATAYPLLGTFPFITMELISPAQQYAVPGGTTSFVLKFVTHEKLSSIDHVFIDFAAPAGWTFEGNLGMDFITTGGNQVIEYEFTTKAPAYAKAGDQAPISVQAALQSAGGHQATNVNVKVAGARVEAPEYTFELLTPGPFKAESPAELRWKIAHNGVPLENFGIGVDFLLNNNVVDSGLPAAQTEPGVYSATYTFISGGAWTADVYVAELEPAPHAEFPVTVASADGGLLPGFGLVGAWGALVVAAWRRRL